MYPADHDGGPSRADGRPQRQHDGDDTGDHAAEHADDGAPANGGASDLLLGPSERSQHREVGPLPADLTGDGLPDEDQRRQPRQHGEGECRLRLVGERVSNGLAVVGARSGSTLKTARGTRPGSLLERRRRRVGGLDRDPGEAEPRHVLDRSPDCRAGHQSAADVAPVEGRQVGTSPHDAHDLHGELRARGRGVTLVLAGQEPAHVEPVAQPGAARRAAASLITVSSKASGSASRPSITTGPAARGHDAGVPGGDEVDPLHLVGSARGPAVGELVGEAVSAHDLR